VNVAARVPVRKTPDGMEWRREYHWGRMLDVATSACRGRHCSPRGTRAWSTWTGQWLVPIHPDRHAPWFGEMFFQSGRFCATEDGE
jgi:hypothetical protein